MFGFKKQDEEMVSSPYILDLRNIKRKSAHYRPNFKKRFFLLSLILPLGLLVFFFFHSRADVIKFYPSACLGDWQNPGLAQNEEVGKALDETNSAVIKFGSTGQLFCGSFSGDIPDNTIPVKAEIKLSLALKPAGAGAQIESKGTEPTSFLLRWLYRAKAEEIQNSDSLSNVDINTVDNSNNSQNLESNDTNSFNEQNSNQSVLGESDSLNETETTAPISDTTSSETITASSSSETTITILETSTTTTTTNTDSSTSSSSTLPSSSASTSSSALSESNITSSIGELSSSSFSSSSEISSASSSSQTETSTSEIALLEISYSLDGSSYQSIGQITNLNWQNWSGEINLNDWDDIGKLSLKIEKINSEAPYDIYLNALWLEVLYQSMDNSDETISDKALEEQNLVLDTDPLGSLEPFVLDLTGQIASVSSSSNNLADFHCQVTPFSQETEINQTARYEVVLEGKGVLENWRLNSTKIPVGFETKISQRPENPNLLDLELTPRKNAIKASYSFGLFFETKGKVLGNCQFNLIVK